MDPIVDVCMDTYNHASFIGQAIESILMQQTSFRYRLIIGEDYSTDCTRSVCEHYASRFPDKIVLLPSDRNYGQNQNKYRTMMACTAKYVALCEGDDYWTDPLKLDKQVRFLEDNKEYALCFHKMDVVDSAGNLLQRGEGTPDTTCYTSSQMMHVFVPTMSMVYRNCLKDYPPEFFKVKGTDAFLVGMLCNHGKAADLGFVGAHYRRHPGGLYNRMSQSRQYTQSLLTRKFMWKSEYFSSTLKAELKRELIKRYKLYTKILLKKGDLGGYLRMNYMFLIN